MAISTYSGQKVKNTDLPSARFSPNATAAAFGGNQGEALTKAGAALQSFGGDMVKVVAESKEKRDKSIARDALNQAEMEAMQYSLGVYNKKGKDAIDSFSFASKDLDGIRAKFSKALENDQQRELFELSFGDSLRGHLKTIYKHQEDQRTEYENATIDAQNKTAQDKAVAYRNSPQVTKEALNTIAANTAYKYRGMGEEVIKQKIGEAQHTLNASIVDAYASENNIEAAIKYLEANKAGFNPTKYPEIEAKLKKQNEIGWIQKRAIELNNSGLSLEEQLAEADKTKDTNLVGKLRDAVKERYKDQEDFYKAKRKIFVESEMDKMLQDPTNYRPPQGVSAKELEDLTALYKKFNDKNKAEAFLRYGAKNAAAGNGKNTVLYNELAALSPVELSAMDLGEFAGKLSMDEWKSIRDLQKLSRLPDSDPNKQKLFRTRSIKEQAKTAITGISDLDPKKGPEQEGRLSKFYEQLDAQVNLLPEEQRTSENIGKIIKTLKEPVTVKGAKYRFELPYISQEAVRKGIEDSGLKYDGIRTYVVPEGYAVEQGNVRVIFDKSGKRLKTQMRAEAATDTGANNG